MRRSAVEAAGGWLNREFMYSQDYDLWLRLLYVGEQKHIERTSIKYRVHAAQLTAVIGTDRMFVSGAAVIRDKLAKWRPEEVFRGLDLNSGAGQVAAYQEINKMLFSPQTAVCGVELDVLKFFGSLIDRPAIDLEARKAKFTLLHGAIALLRQRGHYGSAAEQLWRALRAGAAFEKSLYRILWRKSRELMPKPKARQVSNQS
jgi:hypothetical protein